MSSKLFRRNSSSSLSQDHGEGPTSTDGVIRRKQMTKDCGGDDSEMKRSDEEGSLSSKKEKSKRRKISFHTLKHISLGLLDLKRGKSGNKHSGDVDDNVNGTTRKSRSGSSKSKRNKLTRHFSIDNISHHSGSGRSDPGHRTSCRSLIIDGEKSDDLDSLYEQLNNSGTTTSSSLNDVSIEEKYPKQQLNGLAATTVSPNKFNKINNYALFKLLGRCDESDSEESHLSCDQSHDASQESCDSNIVGFRMHRHKNIKPDFSHEYQTNHTSVKTTHLNQGGAVSKLTENDSTSVTNQNLQYNHLEDEFSFLQEYDENNHSATNSVHCHTIDQDSTIQSGDSTNTVHSLNTEQESSIMSGDMTSVSIGSLPHLNMDLNINLDFQNHSTTTKTGQWACDPDVDDDNMSPLTPSFNTHQCPQLTEINNDNTPMAFNLTIASESEFDAESQNEANGNVIGITTGLESGSDLSRESQPKVMLLVKNVNS